jgi:hypothetical protein
MTMRIRFRWPLLVAALAAGTLLVALKTSPGTRPQEDPAQDAWLKSGDPCYPANQNKKTIEGMGYDSSYIRCVPLTVEVLWEVQEVFHHHAGLGTSRANYSLRDTYTAFLQLTYKSAKSKELQSFQIQAPAPCCPGSVETALESADVVLIVCNQSGRGCKPFASSDSLHFTLEKPTDTAMGLTWDESEGAHANVNSSRVQFNSKAVPEPYRAINGVEVLDGESHTIDVRGTPGFTPEDIDRLIKDGQVQEVFTDKQVTTAPGLPVSGSRSVKATVKLLFTSDWEKWRVTLQGWSKEDTKPDIKYIQSGGEKKIPIRMEFDWSLEGEFIIRNPKKKPAFDSGKITKAGLGPRLVFQGADLFNCKSQNCAETYDISRLVGAPLSGTVNGATLTLSWPQYNQTQCVTCRGKKVIVEKITYFEKFGSTDFMRIVSLQPLTLKNGASVSGKPYEWMSYTITLKKIQ